MVRVSALAAAITFGLAACGQTTSDSQGSAEADSGSASGSSGGSSDSGTGTGSGSAGTPTASDDFCAGIEAAEQSGIEADEDPSAALAALAELEASAPDDLKAHIAVLADLVEELAALPSDDLDSMGVAMEMAFRPEVIAAGLALEEYALEECGIELESSSSSGDGLDPDFDFDSEFDSEFGDDSGFGDGDDDELSLDDISDAKDAAGDASWVDKAGGTGIYNDQFVELIADSDMSSAEALEACQWVYDHAAQLVPDVEVEVTVDGTTVVSSGSSGTCAAA